jgi:hypothetical protein
MGALRSFYILISLLLISVNAYAATENHVTVDRIDFTKEGSFKSISRSFKSDHSCDITLDNTGAYSIKICMKYNYLDKENRKKKVTYLKQIVRAGNRFELHNICFPQSEGFVHLKIKLISCKKKTGLFPFLSPYMKGAEGTLTLIDRE